MADSSKQQYRQQLIEIEQKIHEGYDKTLISLSGGALGISFAFIKNIVGDDEIVSQSYALIAWIAWAVSLTFLLAAFYFGTLAYRHAVKKLDLETIDRENPGGCYATIMRYLNAFGGISFIIGVASFIYFSYINLGG